MASATQTASMRGTNTVTPEDHISLTGSCYKFVFFLPTLSRLVTHFLA